MSMICKNWHHEASYQASNEANSVDSGQKVLFVQWSGHARLFLGYRLLSNSSQFLWKSSHIDRRKRREKKWANAKAEPVINYIKPQWENILVPPPLFWRWNIQFKKKPRQSTGFLFIFWQEKTEMENNCFRVVISSQTLTPIQ